MLCLRAAAGFCEAAAEPNERAARRQARRARGGRRFSEMLSVAIRGGLVVSRSFPCRASNRCTARAIADVLLVLLVVILRELPTIEKEAMGKEFFIGTI